MYLINYIILTLMKKGKYLEFKMILKFLNIISSSLIISFTFLSLIIGIKYKNKISSVLQKDLMRDLSLLLNPINQNTACIRAKDSRVENLIKFGLKNC